MTEYGKYYEKGIGDRLIGRECTTPSGNPLAITGYLRGYGECKYKEPIYPTPSITRLVKGKQTTILRERLI